MGKTTGKVGIPLDINVVVTGGNKAKVDRANTNLALTVGSDSGGENRGLDVEGTDVKGEF